MNTTRQIINKDRDKPVIINANKQYYIPICKSNEEEQTITSVVLQPEVVDAQGDIISQEVISKAAHNFLADYNTRTTLALMHKDFSPQFELYESSIMLDDTVIGNKTVKKGSWLMVVHVLDEEVWGQVKTKKLAGLSIKGKAKVARTQEQELA